MRVSLHKDIKRKSIRYGNGPVGFIEDSSFQITSKVVNYLQYYLKSMLHSQHMNIIFRNLKTLVNWKARMISAEVMLCEENWNVSQRKRRSGRAFEIGCSSNKFVDLFCKVVIIDVYTEVGRAADQILNFVPLATTSDIVKMRARVTRANCLIIWDDNEEIAESD